MSDSTSGVFKLLTWLLLLALITVIALSGWYNSKLKQQIAGRDQTVQQTELRLLQADKQLDSAAKEKARLKQRIEELEADHQSEVQIMTGKLDNVSRTNATLQSKLGQIRKSHAKTLEEERQKATGAIAALQADKDVSDQRVNELEGEIERLNQALVEATKQHEAEMAGALSVFEMHQANREKEAVERFEHYRAALEGSDPELAAKLSALDERIESDAQALRRAAARIESLETVRTDLKKQLEIVTQNLGVNSQALAQTRQDLETERSRFAELQSELDSKNHKLSETEGSLARIEGELRKTREQASLNKTTLEDEVVKSQGKISELERTLAQEREQAAQEKAALQQENREAVAYVRGMLSEMSALGGRKTENGMLFNLGNEQLRFRISSAKLPDRDFPILDQLAELLNKYPELKVRIEGHTDNKGRVDTNIQLSQQRAETVAQELTDRGVSASRMEAIGVGQINPIANNETPYGRALNRRVEVYVTEP